MLDLDPMAQVVRERWDGGERMPTAAAGGERRRASPVKPYLGFPGSNRCAEST
jgi:hypothetical protein